MLSWNSRSGSLSLTFATCGSLVDQLPTTVTLLPSLSLSPIISLCTSLYPINSKKKSPLPRSFPISFLRSLMSDFFAILTLPWAFCPGALGTSASNFIVMCRSHSRSLNFAVLIVGTAFFLVLEYRVGFSVALVGDWLVDCEVGQGDVPL